MRTVRRHSRVHIGKPGVNKSFVIPIKCFVAALKVRGHINVGMNNAYLNGLCVICQRKISESEPTEKRVIDFFFIGNEGFNLPLLIKPNGHIVKSQIVI